MATMLGAVLLVSTTALAGDIKFGEKPLATGAKGELTAEGRKAAVTELENTGPDDWHLHLWAELDGAKKGPLVLEFWGEVQGKRYLVWKHVHAEFTGGKYAALHVKVEGKSGFNKDRTYEVVITQEGVKAKLATGTIKLLKPMSAEEKAEAEKQAEKDAMDEEIESEWTGEPPEEEEAEQAIPPPVEEPPVVRSKGCAIIDPPCFGATALILGLAAVRRRRG
jgi:hypothetical protein